MSELKRAQQELKDVIVVLGLSIAAASYFKPQIAEFRQRVMAAAGFAQAAAVQPSVQKAPVVPPPMPAANAAGRSPL